MVLVIEQAVSTLGLLSIYSPRIEAAHQLDTLVTNNLREKMQMENQPNDTENAQPSAAGVTVEMLKNALRAAPLPTRPPTKKDKLTELMPELKKQLTRGHTADSLAAALTAGGLQVSARALRVLLQPAPDVKPATSAPRY